MKRKILYLLLFMLSFFITEVKAYTISGYVKNSGTQAAIPNKLVALTGDSINVYYDTVLTDATGFFVFQNVPSIPLFSHYFVKAWDCNQNLIMHQIDSLSAFSNFFICQNIPCQANFYSIADTSNNQKFYFINTSTGSPTSFLWNFGDNTTSTLQNPTHIYNLQGSFMVTLTISGNNCSSTIYDTIYAGSPCQANFSALPNIVNPLQVSFTNLSTSGMTGFIWSFGDNTTSYLQNPVHTYAQAGTYSVNLYAYNSICSSNYTLSISVIANCHASFLSLQDSINNSTFHFINTSTGNPTSFLWMFGDGTSSTLQNPSHLYSTSGYFIVSLTISGSGCQSSFFDTIHVVQNIPCDAIFTKLTDSINSATIHFFDQSTGNPTNWLWNFGDGSSSTLQNPIHTYSQSGSYVVALFITTPTCYDSVFQTISVVSNSGSLVMYAFADTTLLNVGTAILYNYNSVNQTITIKDSVSPILYQGVYLFNFPSIPIGSYKVQIKLPSQSPLASTYYNTWLGNSFNWQNSNMLNIQNGSNFQVISLVKNTVILPSGSGIISGNISNFNVGGNIPKAGVQVFLLKNDSSIISGTISDSLGNFIFQNMPFGNYIIFPEVTGIKTIPYYLSLNSSNPNKEGIKFIINANIISIGVEEEKEEKLMLSIFPNPTADFITIQSENIFSSFGELKILDMSGILVFAEKIDMKSNESIKIDISNYTQGVYFLIFTAEKNTITKKIIKI